MQERFGVLSDGRAVEQYLLDNGTVSCGILSYGAALRSLNVRDAFGTKTDVVTGFDTIEDYVRHTNYMGAVIGRCANRIRNGGLPIGDRGYRLTQNENGHHLHGGEHGFDKKLWNAVRHTATELTLTLISPNGEEGYPGTLEVTVTYRIEGAAVCIDYTAWSDADTAVNLTHHAYWNLNGGKTVEGHSVRLCSDRFAPTDAHGIPTGELCSVAGTDFDFRTAKPLAPALASDHPQIRKARGIDHSFWIEGECGTLRLAAEVTGSRGIGMRMFTTEPCVQFYTGNFLQGCPLGKGGAVYKDHGAFCLEAQHMPNSPNLPQFPPILLRAGETYRQTTEYRFFCTNGESQPTAYGFV